MARGEGWQEGKWLPRDWKPFNPHRWLADWLEGNAASAHAAAAGASHERQDADEEEAVSAALLSAREEEEEEEQGALAGHNCECARNASADSHDGGQQQHGTACGSSMIGQGPNEQADDDGELAAAP